MAGNSKQHRPFRLVAYDPHWVSEFEKRKIILASVLGNTAIAIHHIGSTSIPGMMAKPQIDILVVVKDLDDVRQKYDEMRSAHFTARGDYSHIGEEYFTEDLEDGTRLSSVHCVSTGHPAIESQLRFRDYLIHHPEEREAYKAVKKELYEKYADNYVLYDEGKKEIIKKIHKKASSEIEI